MTENLRIKVAASPKDLNAPLTLAKKESWLIAKCDNVLFHAADPSGFFIGMLDGKEVSYISVMTYGDNEHSFISNFLVPPEHREQHKGFGLKIADMAWSMIPKTVTCISATAVESMAPKYKERYGFECAWTDCLFKFNAKDITLLPCPDIAVASYREANFDKLFNYDTSVFGFTRMSFLKKLVEICEGWMAMDEKGDITGYCSVRESATENHVGWILGPWYASDVITAQCLLVQAAKFALSQSNVTSVLSCYMPEINQEGINFARTLSMEQGPSLLRMFYGTCSEVVKKNSKERVFAVTSPSIGG